MQRDDIGRETFDRLNQRLVEVKENLRRRQKLQNALAGTQQALSQERSRLATLEAECEREDVDVKKLQGLSLTGLFYTVLGSKEQQIEKERQEYLAAKLKCDECAESVLTLEGEATDLEAQLAQFDDLDQEYQSILDEKAEAIARSKDENAGRLLGLSEGLADLQSDAREVGEALQAGHAAALALESMIDSLRGATNWGTWDMLGGGLITTAIKHSRIDTARHAAHRAQQLLRVFHRELADVQGPSGLGLEVDISPFLGFADYFFDGLIVDWVVQSRIRSSLEHAVDTKAAVEAALQSLRTRSTNLRNNAQALAEERRNVLEGA